MIRAQPSRFLTPRRMRDLVAVGQRYRRWDGLVIRVENPHRADKTAEVQAEAPVQPSDPWRIPSKFSVSFDQLRREYDLLVGLEKLR